MQPRRASSAHSYSETPIHTRPPQRRKKELFLDEEPRRGVVHRDPPNSAYRRAPAPIQRHTPTSEKGKCDCASCSECPPKWLPQWQTEQRRNEKAAGTKYPRSYRLHPENVARARVKRAETLAKKDEERAKVARRQLMAFCEANGTAISPEGLARLEALPYKNVMEIIESKRRLAQAEGKDDPFPPERALEEEAVTYKSPQSSPPPEPVQLPPLRDLLLFAD